MINKLSHDARIYTDMDGLERLRHQSKTHPELAKKEVSRQFEALLMQILLRSMRDANKPFASDLFGGDQMALYQDLLDKQMTLVMAETGTGFAEIIEKNIDQQNPGGNKTTKNSDFHYSPQKNSTLYESKPVQNVVDKKLPLAPMNPVSQQPFHSQEEFVKKLWSSAKQAASILGVDPKILLAQAALETDWGKKVITNSHSEHSSHNLFNIKADSNWNKNTTVMDTLEQKDGVLVKEKASFRSYDSYTDSFMDYVHFLKNNNRYESALNRANDPKQFVQALQEAGFATDSNYAEKIYKIFSSRSFKNIADKMQ